ncbi:hypothetical protein PGT21_033120 [Puccinia graminis f. sp. tritici]|uniref:Uncharacterized protein n=1 Tax=Puccinia graminis f. sp. tritici TaxID=56615 RepID=A0A5B0R2L4_PUCGR|nr:hypothetical protein PGTUg99_030190 [Puccinia graminis f. sp. tritici]KAA1119746.1 hypothetical protein PGT21_033120 [Puccinia graminis f. sp. tritici]
MQAGDLVNFVAVRNGRRSRRRKGSQKGGGRRPHDGLRPCPEDAFFEKATLTWTIPSARGPEDALKRSRDHLTVSSYKPSTKNTQGPGKGTSRGGFRCSTLHRVTAGQAQPALPRWKQLH